MNGFGSIIILTLVSVVTMEAEKQVEQLLERSIDQKKILALLLDYDGTLSPIVDHPDLAVLPDDTRAILNDLVSYKNVYVAFITGRQLSDIKQKVDMPNVTYAGNHGFHIIFRDGTRFEYKVPDSELQRIYNIRDALKNEVVRDGAMLEDKGNVLTLHYRQTPEEKRPALIKHAHEVSRRFGLEFSDALNCLEVQPNLEWNKGYAAKQILETEFGIDWEEKVNVVFAGDDTTDENLIKMFSGKATTLRIVNDDSIETAASLRVKTLEEVKTMLKWIQTNYN